MADDEIEKDVDKFIAYLNSLRPQQFDKFIESLPTETRETLLSLFRERAVSRPDRVVEAVKALRRTAADPVASRQERVDAMLLLKRTQFDDASLRKDDTGSEDE